MPLGLVSFKPPMPDEWKLNEVSYGRVYLSDIEKISKSTWKWHRHREDDHNMDASSGIPAQAEEMQFEVLYSTAVVECCILRRNQTCFGAYVSFSRD